MRKIQIAVNPAYEVILGEGILQDAGRYLQAQLACNGKVLLISDSNVFPLYGERVRTLLEAAEFRVDHFVFQAGEQSKNMTNLGRILEYLAERHFTRTDCVVSLGGGVTGDLGGFAAACYMRGVPFVQMPTTLLAAVDSSVGGKTAVNLEKGKNLAGAFWQPKVVLCDLNLLKTLPREHFAEGMAEVLKYGVLDDADLFASLENGMRKELLEHSVAACVSMKGRYVAEDERDQGQRQFLNLGHTIGHAIEKISGYKVSHGNAVAVGMVKITESAIRRKIADPEMLLRLKSALQKNHLPVDCDYPMEKLVETMASDKKCQGRKITLVIPEKIGRCRLEKMNLDDLREFLCVG